ncbi:6,7-dimethyl-8-ribityllumazine synthase [Candidatus Gracilibacteria bacterium]|nr:6,7-dimethyl-8-ribityllumazine synthase [Candidatus Gracilibacteria bacterium]
MKIAIVAAQFNTDISERLTEGAIHFFEHYKKQGHPITYKVFHVPGALELPALITKLAETKQYDGYIALGCVIKGETDHYGAVCDGVTYGLQMVSITKGAALTNGVLMCTHKDQAIERSMPKQANNKGYECAQGIVQMVQLFKELF